MITITKWMRSYVAWMVLLAACLPAQSTEYIVYAKLFDGPELWKMRPDGTDRLRLLVSSDSEYRDPVLSPAGDRIAFTLLRAGDPAVYVCDAAGQGLSEVTGQAREPAWSPDGKSLAYARSLDDSTEIIAVLCLLTGQEQPLTNGLGSAREPAWSPDGHRIAYVSDRDRRARQTDVWAVDVVAGTTQNLTTGLNQANASPAWSPDGRQIVFSSRSSRGAWTLWALDIETGLFRSLHAERGLRWPSWSPDGRWLVLGREGFSPPPALRLLDTQSGQLTDLNETGLTPSWGGGVPTAVPRRTWGRVKGSVGPER